MSESEVELDGPQNEVTLPQDLPGRGNVKLAKSAIRCRLDVIINCMKLLYPPRCWRRVL